MPACPKCGAPIVVTAIECPKCGIVLEQFHHRGPGGRRHRSRRGGSFRGVVLIAAVVILLVAVVYSAMMAMGPKAMSASPLPPGSAMLTYADGTKCPISNWRFAYVREFQPPNKPAGAYTTMIPLQTKTTTKRDDDLHIFNPSGSRVVIKHDDLRTLRFVADGAKSDATTVSFKQVELDTASGTMTFRPQPVPASNKQRFLIPNASKFFKQKDYTGDYKSWRNVTLHMQGTTAAPCTQAKFSLPLTVDRARRGQVPLKIDFEGAS